MDPENDDRLREPLDDEERELMDPDTWDWDSIEVLPPVPNPGVVLSIRFSLDEMTRISRAAEAQGITIFEYIKQSALTRVMHDVVN
jgi:hypothetical protein